MIKDKLTRVYRKRLDQFFPYVLSFPLLLLSGVFCLYPVYKGLILSLFEDQHFVGIQNYITLFNDYKFWDSLKMTIFYVLEYTAGIFFVGFITALLISYTEKKRAKGTNVISAIITLPYAIPDVIASLIWVWMLDYQVGIINYVLKALGLVDKSVFWFLNPSLALHSVIMVTIWRLFPLHTLIILGGFRTIPIDVYEAAEIDGAGSVRKFFSITLPILWNILSLLLLLTIIWSFKRFTILWLLTSGGPGRATETLVIRIYRSAFLFLQRNYASTMGSVGFAIVSVIAIFYLFYTSRT